MMIKLTLSIIVFALLTNAMLAVDRRECVPRDYGNNGTVCVCNVTYCDNLNAIQRTSSGIITLYESSLSGQRFKETRFTFNHNFAKFNGQLKQTVKINYNKRYQNIIGFGGSFTDATGINIKSLPTQLQINFLSDHFSKNGLDYNLCRVPLGGSDFSTRPYTYDDVANDTDLSYFSLQPEDFNYKIPYIKLARTLSADQLKLFACPWSAPAWLKTTGTINGGGTIIGEPGDFYYKIWANYFVKFLNAYERQDIRFWGLTVQNEPAFGYLPNHPFNSMGMTKELERDFIRLNLGPTLQANGYGINKLNLIVGDDQRPNYTYAGVVNNPSVFDWAEAVFGNNTVNRYVAGVGFHWYLNALNGTDALDQTYHKYYPNYFILATEACNGFIDNKVLLGSWQRGEAYAIDIIEDLNHFTSGWVDWNMALDVEGGPNWVNNFVDAPIIVNASAQEYYKQPMFYALGHFSKFITPNSTRIELETDINIDNFMTTAFIRPDNGIVVIAVNTNDESVLLTIENTSNRRVVREVQPHSIQSYIWWN